MGHGHDHGHSVGGGPSTQRRLWAALLVTAGFLLVEVVASVLTGSLALLSDAGHMATDVAGLAIALLAIRIGRRQADEKRSFGYRRLEIIAAALNAAALFMVAGYVLIEAVQRLQAPPPVASVPMLVVAAIGLVINMVAMRLLRAGRESSLNVRGAYLEVWADFLGSIAVLIGAGLIWLTGARWIDPVIAILIALWVLPRGWTLLRSAMHVLLEGTPQGIDPEAVKRTLQTVEGVRVVHDLHLWSITTGVPLLSAHLVVDQLADWEATLERLKTALEKEHHIRHATLQPETVGHRGECDSTTGCPL